MYSFVRGFFFCLSLSILVLLDYRREVLRKWQDKFGLDATYKCLLEILAMSQHKEGAKAVCRVLRRRGEIYVQCVRSKE